jgi:CBS domain-containing protein
VWAIAEGRDLDRTSAEEVMTADLASASPDETVRGAARRMLDNEIRHLPVIEHGAVVGVISVRDVLEAFLGRSA